MISNPKNGWCDFKLGEIEFSLSYLTNVPIDLLNCFIAYYEYGCSACWFDMEGSEMTFVLNPDAIYLIVHGKNYRLHEITNTRPDKMGLAYELVNDIESDRTDWNNWDALPDPEIIKRQENSIDSKLLLLKEILAKRKGI